MNSVRNSVVGGCLVSLSILIFLGTLSAQTVTILAHFNGSNGTNLFSGSALTQGTDGNFYGASSAGGLNNNGTVFRITPAGHLTTIYNFCSLANCADGSSPNGTLLLGPGGNLYGTTQFGGSEVCGISGCGTVFEITPSGKLTTLHTFCTVTNCPDGGTPQAGLTLGPNGNLFGTTWELGLCGRCGTIFEITPSGQMTTLHSFNGTDGSAPATDLVLANNGYFYGTAGGGRSAGGTIFAISPSGLFVTLANFSYTNRPNELTLTADGNLLGTQNTGGIGAGSIFEMTPTGSISMLYDFSFCTLPCVPDFPRTGAIQGSDGNFYGAASGGQYAEGALYQFNPDGTFTDLYNFCALKGCPDGTNPDTLLVQGTDGVFYGATADGNGTIFSLSMGLAPFVKATPNLSRIGGGIAILGNNLTGTTSVTFNGTPATFKVVSSTLITATVPAGATTGTIEVTTPGGALNSNLAFQVLP